MGKCLSEKGLLEAALRQYQQADKGEETLEALYELGMRFEAKGALREARQCWEAIYAVDVAFRDVASRVG